MRKRILVAVGVVAVVAAVAVPVVVAATPSPTVKPAVTAKPVTVADDHGGLTKAKSRDDPASRWSS